MRAGGREAHEPRTHLSMSTLYGTQSRERGKGHVLQSTTAAFRCELTLSSKYSPVGAATAAK